MPGRDRQTLGVAILLLAGLLILASGLRYSNLLNRFDTLSYDLLLPVQAPQMSKDIVIIDIDDASIMELGRWPWPRNIHAELLNVLSQYDSKAIGLDIIFSEPQEASADQALAEAIEKNGKTFLITAPVLLSQGSGVSELLPMASLAAGAAGIGHVDVELDLDGLNRKFHAYGGMGDAHWPSMPLAMAQFAKDPVPQLDQLQNHNTEGRIVAGWVRNKRGLIPFTLRQDQATRLSYADVLRQRIKLNQLNNKYLFVGVTATGIGDRIATPSYREHERMPGVELLAQQLNGLLQGKVLQELNPWQQWLISILIILLGASAIMLAPLRYGFSLTLVFISASLTLSAMLLASGYWFAPAASIACLMICWPLWNLWRLHYQAKTQQELQDKLDELSSRNPLTELPNQGALERELASIIQAQSSQHVALIICHFNWSDASHSIYDQSLGKAGLLQITEQLREINRPGYFMAHLNSDDFAFLVSDDQQGQNTLDLLERLDASFSRPITRDRQSLILSPNMGISCWPKDSHDAGEAMRNASTALFKARMDEKDSYCFYSETIGQEVQARYELEQALVHAIDRLEFELHFQPRIDVRDGSCNGLEALLRWKNPKLGWISPSSFIPVAEHSGMISVIGDWVLKKACFHLKQLRELGHEDIQMGLNISPQQFLSENFVSRVQLIVMELGLPPSSLEFEVTESTLMRDIDTAMKVMSQLNDFGIGFTIDDFGTGYSSLSHLKQLPYKRIKIDQSFTQEIDQSANAREIILSVIEMAKRLELSIVAEGVEQNSHKEFLSSNGCHELQGFLFSPALPFEELKEYLAGQ
ncbi:MAG: EAL domain-containing protein [Cellvibrionaceae bacterium]|nr:EAL domain-containing protein [Cellvibrionaceae bacterium]